MAVSITTMQITSQPVPSRYRAIPALLAAAMLFGSASASSAQVELKTYADAKGYIVVRNLTCAQLAGTFQEDADFLGVWYSGWFNGRNKKHTINVDRTKAGIHEVIVYCKANPDKKVVDAIDVVLKRK
jgi:HdeA/HdeB family